MATSNPTSPISPSDDMIEDWNYNNVESVDNTLNTIGVEHLVHLSESLQGNIWRGTYKDSTPCAIKVANKYLHQQSKGVADGLKYLVHENIETEQAILKYLTQQKDCPQTIVKYHAFYESDTNYYFLMEFGGCSLFNFVQKAHHLVEKKKLDIRHWQKVVNIIFSQMVECIAYIHSLKVCHFDISLENFLINDVSIEVHQEKTNKQEKITFVLDEIKVKLCDFGLAQLFTSKECKSTKFCGKTGYKSPEICARKSFDAKKNDIWALGVCLFMMLFGCTPWQKAKKSDESFVFIMTHSIEHILDKWNILHYANDVVLYLLQAVFQCETNRISLHHIQEFSRRYM